MCDFNDTFSYDSLTVYTVGYVNGTMAQLFVCNIFSLIRMCLRQRHIVSKEFMKGQCCNSRLVDFNLRIETCRSGYKFSINDHGGLANLKEGHLCDTEIFGFRLTSLTHQRCFVYSSGEVKVCYLECNVGKCSKVEMRSGPVGVYRLI